MPFQDFIQYIETGGAAAAATFCTGPQALACAAMAGAALTAVGAVGLYGALVNADWEAYRAYEASIEAANAYAIPPEFRVVGTPEAPVRIPDYPDTREDEDWQNAPPQWQRPPNGPNWAQRLLDLIAIGTGAENLLRFIDYLTCPQPSPYPLPATPHAPTQRRGPGGCRTSGLESIVDIGKRAHLQVQYFFLRNYPPRDGMIEVPILNAGPGGGVGKADAVLYTEGTRLGLQSNNAGIYENKPISYSRNALLLFSAIQQLNRYVRHFPTRATPGVIWHPIDQYIGPWQLDPSQGLYTTSYYNIRAARGLVFYYCRQ